MEMNCTSATEFIPWLLNGSLDEGERRELERHMADCAACREELRETVEYFEMAASHPPPEVLVDWVEGRDVPDAELVERHVAGCPACIEEVGLVRETLELEALAPIGETTARFSVVGWRRTALAAAAVAVLGLGALVVSWAPGGFLARRTGATFGPANLPVIEVFPDGFTLRGGSEALTIKDGDGAVALILATRASGGWDSYRLRVIDDSDSELFRVDDLIRRETDDFTVLLPVSGLPTGEISLIIDGSKDGSWTELETYTLVNPS